MERRTRWFIAVAACCIILGAGFRMWRLDGSAFSSDEVVAAQHVAGYTERDVIAALAGASPVQAAAARRFAAPGPQHSVRDVVATIAAEDPQHPPLFYVLAHGWGMAAGSSVAAKRALPALFGLLGIIAAAWLCGQVTRSAIGGWAGAALYALSPFQVVYAQELREYSLYATVTMLATALLITSLRRPRPALVATYALACVAGLYTFTLFPLVIAAHVTILAVIRPARDAAARSLTAMAVATAAWTPWIVVLLARRNLITSTNDWSGTRWSPVALAAKWLFNGASAFFDLLYLDPRWAPVSAGVLVVVACALIALRRSTIESRAVAFSLLAWCFGALALVDITAGGHRSTIARYVTPAFCALVVAVAAWVADASKRQGRAQVFPFAAAALLCLAGLASITTRASRGAWWDNAKDGGIRPIAAAIDAARVPVLVTDVNWPILIDLALSTRTNPSFLLVPASSVGRSTALRGDVLVVTTSRASRAAVAATPRAHTKLVYAAATTSGAVSLFRRRLVKDASSNDDGLVDDSRAALLRVEPRTVARR